VLRHACERFSEERAREHHELVKPQLVDAAPLAAHRLEERRKVLPRDLQVAWSSGIVLV
jgi:hypothetical protein